MVQPRLLAILSEQLYYDEIAIPFTRMQNECKQLISLLADANVDLQDRFSSSVFTIDQANELVRACRLNGSLFLRRMIEISLFLVRKLISVNAVS